MSNDKTIEYLNTALQMEMSAAHQYQLNAQVLEDWGLTKLAKQMQEEMREEWGHSDQFIARILFLKGKPELAFEKPPVVHDNLVDLFKADLADEENAIEVYTKGSPRWPMKSVISVPRLCSRESFLTKKGTKPGSNCSLI